MARNQLVNVWLPAGRMRRETYVLAGLVLFAVKFALDNLLAQIALGQPWPLWAYVAPVGIIDPTSFDDRVFVLAFLVQSLPFAWLGVMLTVKRLPAAGLPLGLAALFFAPLINLVLFVTLAVMPSKAYDADDEANAPPRPRLSAVIDALIPAGRWPAACLAVGLTGILGVVGVAVAANAMQQYGWVVFVGLPAIGAILPVLIFGYHGPRSFPDCLAVAMAANGLVGVLAFVTMVEGAICLMMALPLWIPCAFLGAVIGFAIVQAYPARSVPPTLWVALLLMLPVLLGAERLITWPLPVHRVQTVMHIDAPPQVVWDHVVAFPDLAPPDDWLFHLGIAYPVRARIEGEGVGAVRYCEFNTGTFVEPIDVWDEPNRLKFRVTHNPAPMRELSLVSDLHPPHLDGFLESQAGEFRLVALPDGTTRLEGTTWYRHRMWPQAYWRLWSDHIIHRIHLRVLRHIKHLAEDATTRGAS